jgi:site-specific recombinase XerC
VSLDRVEPITVAAYVEHVQRTMAPASVKLVLAAVRQLFDWLSTGQVLSVNPARHVRGPRIITTRGKTPALTPAQARQRLDAIDTRDVIGLRDRALIGVMLFSFGRVTAVAGMCVEDYFPAGEGWWFRLAEKGGRRHEVPAHHCAAA